MADTFIEMDTGANPITEKDNGYPVTGNILEEDIFGLEEGGAKL
jgi:hypothetical protein